MARYKGSSMSVWGRRSAPDVMTTAADSTHPAHDLATGACDAAIVTYHESLWIDKADEDLGAAA